MKIIMNYYKLYEMQPLVPLYVIFAIVAAAVLLYINSRSISRSRRSGSDRRFSEMRTAQAKITSIEQEKYYVKPYQPTLDQRIDVSYVEHLSRSAKSDPAIRAQIMLSEEQDRLIEMKKHRDAAFNKTGGKDIEKIRFKVNYEFSTDNINRYTGECCVYELNENTEVGRYIDIRYNPNNPNINYTVQNFPI